MFRLWRPNLKLLCRLRIGAGAIAVLFGLAAAAQATVIATGDPENNYNGVSDVMPSIFTIDPFDEEVVTDNARRGIAGDRRLRQTFKNPSAFDVGEIVFSFDVTGEADVGLGVRLYEVDDVMAGTWDPGTLIKELVFTDILPDSDNNMSFSLTGGDVFTLPARSDGTQGYGIEISTPFALSEDGNPGVLYYNNDGTDHYADGQYYNEGGGGNSSRDIGLSLLESDAPVFDPGDVDGMNGVNLDDLAIIAAHFRQEGTYAEGDLSGNGFVDFGDFDIWKQNYPGAFPAEAAMGLLGVPEPASAMLALCGAVGLLGCGRRSRRSPAG